MFMKPPPQFDPKQNNFRVPKRLAEFVATMLGDNRSRICAQQVMWLASLPLDALDSQAEPLFRWVADGIKLPGLIPIDNRRTILGR
jgi:hypothetical protein